MNIDESRGPEMWLTFEFPPGCELDDSWKNSRRRGAAETDRGTCCPYYLCQLSSHGPLCDPKTADFCAKRCEEFYEKYVEEKKE